MVCTSEEYKDFVVREELLTEVHWMEIMTYL